MSMIIALLAASAVPATTTRLVDKLFSALEAEDVAAAEKLFAKDAQFVLPYNPNGDASDAGIRRFPAPTYLTVATRSYDNIRFVNRRSTLSHDGRTLFVEATGELVVAATGKPYRNRYVFRFQTDGRKITDVTEYANPLTVAQQGVAARPATR